MSSTRDIILFDSATILLKGPNGTGKTAAAATFKKHKDGKIYFFDFDGKMDTVRFMFPEWDIEYGFFGLHNFKEFMDKFERLQDKCDYDTIVIDSFTSLSMTVVNHQLGVKSVKKNTAGMPVTGWEEINGETVWIGKMLDISKVLREYRKKIVIWTAHPINKMEIVDGQQIRTRPITAYGPKIGSIAPSAFSEIYHFEVEKTSLAAGAPLTRVCYTQNTGEDYAKSSLGLPAKLDFTSKYFYDVIKENIGKVNPMPQHTSPALSPTVPNLLSKIGG